MKIAVVQFPGSNCERETLLAIRRAGMDAQEFLWNEPVAKLSTFDGYVIVGGFSYEDRSRAGIIAACDPVLKEIKGQSEKGKPVLGICNGAQILVESGMVPGLQGYKTAMALTENKRMAEGKILGTGFYNAWINLRVSEKVKPNAFTRYLHEDQIINIPSAHAEGRFVMSYLLLDELREKGLIAFQYCDEQGELKEHFPVNPNGSLANIAAVMNSAGNVMAMMPHPERCGAGDVIFNSMRDYIADTPAFKPDVLKYEPLQDELSSYSCPKGSHETLVELMITDNQALTVQNTLQRMGMKVRVKRFTHWEIEGADTALLKAIEKTGVLYNERKEKALQPQEITINKEHAMAFLVRPKDNLVGQQKLQTLKDHFAIDNLASIKQAVVWLLTTKDASAVELSSQIINTHILSNPYAYDCYRYEFTI